MELTSLKINKNRIQILNDMGIYKVEDLLSYYPYKYEMIEKKYPTNEDPHLMIEGKVISPCNVFFKGRLSRLTFKLIDEYENEYSIFIFNRHYLKSQLQIGTTVTVIGKADGSKITAQDIKIKSLKELEGLHPVYSLKGSISNNAFIKYIDKAFNADIIEDSIPEEFILKNNLINKNQALHYIHRPSSYEDIHKGIQYLKYEEFLNFCITNEYIKNIHSSNTGIAKNIDESKLYSFIDHLPFTLTDDQKQSIKEIVNDLKKEKTMYRLLQGDVGSGKTVVSSIALYANYLAGYQGALMVPTEILALQHFNTLKDFFKDIPVEICLLTGSTPLNIKKEIYYKLKNNEIDILIGTHALFQEKVEYGNLGLVITDEQHRFGVSQRKALKAKGHLVDFLVMTATPIPRTLAISLFGDMDVSTIYTKPANRKPVITKYVPSTSMKPILNDLIDYLKSGGQVYVVCPLIEDSNDTNLRNASQIAEAMTKYFEPEFHVGLMHGRMDDESKNSIMASFSLNRIQILVSTTVIEVGMDVKNANMMVIYNAERFGLSQIHQLRGRVGRSDAQSYCYLLSDVKDEDTINKLKFIESTSDGFEISKYDLSIRGPGDMLGVRQSGIPSFNIGNPLKDLTLLECARNDAKIITADYLNKHYYSDFMNPIISKINHNNEYID